MRKNTELSCYLRGIAFFDERFVDGASKRQKQEVHKNLQIMAQFDMLVMRPLIEYGRIAYTEVPLEDKLSGLVNKFEHARPKVVGSASALHKPVVEPNAGPVPAGAIIL